MTLTSWVVVRLTFALDQISPGRSITPPVKAALVELSKVRDLAHKYVFVYQRNPVQEVRTAFKTACKRAGIQNL